MVKCRIKLESIVKIVTNSLLTIKYYKLLLLYIYFVLYKVQYNMKRDYLQILQVQIYNVTIYISFRKL